MPNLLEVVQPAEGWLAIVGIKGKAVKQHLVNTKEAADTLIQKFVKEERNVFFGVAKFASNAGRKKDNVLSLKAFWLDVDCGPDKAKPNPKTGIPGGYATQLDAFNALKTFCRTTRLPKPIIVNSGRGLHVYWALTADISREEWEPVAAQLRDLCVKNDFYIDPAVFEVARVLRVPGTYNFKGATPKEVRILTEAPPVKFLNFCAALGVEKPTVKNTNPSRAETSMLGKVLTSNLTSSFAKIMRRSAAGDGCQQLLSAYQDRANISEPRWFDALSVAKFCEDSEKAIQKLSSDHPDYTYESTVKKISHIGGPHTCTQFEITNPGGCEGCPFKTKISGPIQLGRGVKIATAEDNIVTVECADEEVETHEIPPYPKPFFRGKNGGIYREPYPAKGNKPQEADPIWVFEHDLYVVKRMNDEGEDAVVMKLHMPKDGVREFIIHNRIIANKNELRAQLAGQGVLCSEARFTMLIEYIHAGIRELRHQRKAEAMRTQFGWADNNTKIIIGDREITKDGIFHSPPSSLTMPTALKMVPVGSLDRWKEIFSMYGKEGLEPHAFAALSAFGSLLFKFTGQSGALINLCNSKSGTGKTTILHMINSVYGHPKKLCMTQKDTPNSKIALLGILNNLPATVDELTNMRPEAASEFSYSVSQGTGKNRMKAQTNELRRNTTTWATVSVCSSNASLYEKLSALKTSPEGEMMRIIEYPIDFTDVIPKEDGKQIFDFDLMRNYGHAGVIFAEYLVSNLETEIERLHSTQFKIDQELKLTQRERFWSAAFAANLVAGAAAKRLGLLDWDLKRIYAWVATDLLMSLRRDVTAPVTNYTAIVGDYLLENVSNTLILNGTEDSRSKMTYLPDQEPRGALLIRMEKDTKKIFILSSAFKKHCVKNQINYKDIIKNLTDAGFLLSIENKRMATGTKLVIPLVRALVLDGSHPDFIDMDKFVPSEAQDASGEH